MLSLNPQTMSFLLSLLGVVVLIVCLILIGTRRVPELSVPQKLKGFGLDLNISVVTLLVLVGLILALSSTFLQVKNYDMQLTEKERQVVGLQQALDYSKRMNLNAAVNFEGVEKPEDINIEDLQCRYYIDNPDSTSGWKENAKLTPSVYGLGVVLTLEDISPKSRIEAIEVIDKNPEHRRTWRLDNVGYVLQPKYTLRKAR